MQIGGYPVLSALYEDPDAVAVGAINGTNVP